MIQFVSPRTDLYVAVDKSSREIKMSKIMNWASRARRGHNLADCVLQTWIREE